jgi:hypothetical protein
MTSAYRQRVDAANLAASHHTVQDAAKSILASLKSIENYLYWALDPEEAAAERMTWERNMIEQAHELVDQAHEFRLRVRANPPQPEPDDAA